MSTSKIAITIDDSDLKTLNRLVRSKAFPNRSKIIQEAVREKLQKLEHNRLAKECAKLEPEYEQALADEGLTRDEKEWPEY